MLELLRPAFLGGWLPSALRLPSVAPSGCQPDRLPTVYLQTIAPSSGTMASVNSNILSPTMTQRDRREAFIPYRRSDLIHLCLDDGKLSDAAAQTFCEFCEILAAYYHFQFHHILESLKDNYAPFNPDADTQLVQDVTESDRQHRIQQLMSTFHALLKRANYIEVPKASLERAFREQSLIDLNTHVDFNDFDAMVCYCRGDVYKEVIRKKWIFWKKKDILDVFERVAVFLTFKNADYFARKNKQTRDRPFQPGQSYVYLYRNIPKSDIEFVFPNVEISMTLKDRLLLVIPGIGAAIAVIARALPQLLLIAGAILFFIDPPGFLEQFKASERDIQDLMPVLAALLSLLVVFGGFAFKQYTAYQMKQIKFQKNVTDTLFFRNVASNLGVFYTLIDAAEEEECKEIILVYYHLLTHPEPLTDRQLDQHIEQWMKDKFGTVIDFDIRSPLRHLQQLRGELTNPTGEAIANVPILTYDPQGRCHVLPLHQAKTVVDSLWDRAFQYAGCEATE